MIFLLKDLCDDAGPSAYCTVREALEEIRDTLGVMAELGTPTGSTIIRNSPYLSHFVLEVTETGRRNPVALCIDDALASTESSHAAIAFQANTRRLLDQGA